MSDWQGASSCLTPYPRSVTSLMASSPKAWSYRYPRFIWVASVYRSWQLRWYA